jgi:hypothetical protein
MRTHRECAQDVFEGLRTTTSEQTLVAILSIPRLLRHPSGVRPLPGRARAKASCSFPGSVDAVDWLSSRDGATSGRQFGKALGDLIPGFP